MVVTYINNNLGSAYLSDINVGDSYDLNLSLQKEGISFDQMITTNGTGSNGFSGSMTVIPEPMTITLLGIGGLLFATKRTVFTK